MNLFITPANTSVINKGSKALSRTLWFCLALLFVESAAATPTQPTLVPQAILFACDRDYPPFSYMDAERFAGFDIEFINELGGKYNIDVTIEAFDWAEALSRLERGQVDVLSGILWTNERSSRFDFSIPYFFDRYTVFSRRGSGISSSQDLAGKRLAVLNGDACLEEFVRPNGLDNDLILTPTYSEALQLVATDYADYTIAPYSLGVQAIRESGISSVIAAGRSLFSVEYRFAVREGRHDLLFFLNNAIATMTKAEAQAQIAGRLGMPLDDELDSSVSPFIISALFLAFAIPAVAFAVYALAIRKNAAAGIRAQAEAEFFKAALEAAPIGFAWVSGPLAGANSLYAKLATVKDSSSASMSELGLIPDRSKRPKIRERNVIVNDSNGRKLGELVIKEDRTELAVLETSFESLAARFAEKDRKIHQLQVQDPVSAVFNRNYLKQAFVECQETYNRYGAPFAWIDIEIDGLEAFTRINGYNAADSSLALFAEFVKNRLRHGDIFGRVSDARFFALLPRTGSSDASAIAERIKSDTRNKDNGMPFSVKSLNASQYEGKGFPGLLDFPPDSDPASLSEDRYDGYLS